MSKHTPGPWQLETAPTSAGLCHKIGHFPSAGVRPLTYACVYGDGLRIGVDDSIPVAVELHANARLIAAAPELLEALQRLERRGYLANSVCAGDDGNSDLSFARAAIAKATGEHP